MATDTGSPPAPLPSPGDRPRQTPAARRPARRVAAAWLLPLVVVAAAGVLRFHDLGDPGRIYFDETYYVADARAILADGVENGFAVHPPVGKWVIAAGIAVAGDDPAGWRVGPAAAGTLAVALTYLAGLRLFARRGPAALAALLVAVDGLAFTMSRIAMLDATLMLFVLAGFWLLLLDRDRLWRGLPATPPDRGERRPVPRRAHALRWLAGAAFGLALATKWSGLLAIGGAGLFVLGSELAFRRRTTGRALAGWPRMVGSVAATLVLVPAAVYVATYGPWFANYEHTRPAQTRCADPPAACVVPAPALVSDWFGEQADIARFHLDLEADHPYQASPLTWPVLHRPVAYYYESCSAQRRAELAEEGGTCAVAPGNVAHILGIGNPALWWLALAAYPVLLWGGARRDWRALAIAALLFAQYLPWLAANRPAFLFYLTPVVPFVALALTYAAWQGVERRALRWVPAAVAVAAVAAFLYWHPVLAGLEMPREAWQQRMWLRTWV